MSFYIDLTEFLVNPITTGIQRIVGEMCIYSPPNTMVPVRLYEGRYVALPAALVEAIGRLFSKGSQSGVEEINELGAAKRGAPIRISQNDTVLIPEVFDNPQRLAFFRAMAPEELRRCRFFVHDLLPATHPEYFPAESIVHIGGYFRLLREATHCGFNSQDTRDNYYGRLKRTPERDGVVLPLGCDSLGPRPERLTVNRPLTFSVLGTIEPRKNHEVILEAFEPLLREVDGLRLSFVGRLGWVESEFARKVQALAADKNSGFQFFSAPGDGAIRRCIEESRATVYVSAAEGYGLPPVESLWVGTPVIASMNIPSLKSLGTLGIHFVEPLTAANLRDAVRAFLDDGYAKRKTEETMEQRLPTWRSFTQEVLRWCGQEGANQSVMDHRNEIS
jgi:glycosyltransferase involved in cell wall biosynthesis